MFNLWYDIYKDKNNIQINIKSKQKGVGEWKYQKKN